MPNRERLSVVFSFKNEEEVLPELLERMKHVLGGLDLDYEMIFVNDASLDLSLLILSQAAEHEERIKILTMTRSFGVTPCFMAGIRHAQGDAVIVMDCDLQDPPEVIPALVEKWREGAEIVYTVRTKRRGESVFKTWLTRAAYSILNKLSEIPFPVDAGEFKLMSRRAVQELVKIDEKDAYLRGLVLSLGFRQVPVYYERQPRPAGKSHFPLTHPGPHKTFLSGLISFSFWPLAFSFLVGFFSLLAAALGFFALAAQFVRGQKVDTHLILFFGQCFLGAVQLFSIGLLGLYVGRIYQQSLPRPSYIIDSKINFKESESRLTASLNE